MPLVTLALGSNLGDRLANLHSAVASLPPVVTRLRLSPVYETPPWGITDQPAYLNMVLQGRTRLAPLELLKALKNMETRLGRCPTYRWGPRLIDLDILFYDDLQLDTPGLVIPHPGLQERTFVLVPLADLAPGLVHPRLKKTVSQLLAALDASGVKRYEPAA